MLSREDKKILEAVNMSKNCLFPFRDDFQIRPIYENLVKVAIAITDMCNFNGGHMYVRINGHIGSNTKACFHCGELLVQQAAE